MAGAPSLAQVLTSPGRARSTGARRREGRGDGSGRNGGGGGGDDDDGSEHAAALQRRLSAQGSGGGGGGGRGLESFIPGIGGSASEPPPPLPLPASARPGAAVPPASTRRQSASPSRRHLQLHHPHSSSRQHSR